ncbi:hypothetical protein C8R47DRAFT_1147468 [Mycena vitilis]|nr:hypothetical protein C8R47DRAFT_1147468 [Mycena vitilis]
MSRRTNPLWIALHSTGVFSVSASSPYPLVFRNADEQNHDDDSEHYHPTANVHGAAEPTQRFCSSGIRGRRLVVPARPRLGQTGRSPEQLLQGSCECGKVGL